MKVSPPLVGIFADDIDGYLRNANTDNWSFLENQYGVVLSSILGGIVLLAILAIVVHLSGFLSGDVGKAKKAGTAIGIVLIAVIFALNFKSIAGNLFELLN